VPNGSTKEFTVSFTIGSVANAASAYYVYGYVDYLRWDTSDADYDGLRLDWGLDNFKTDKALIWNPE